MLCSGCGHPLHESMDIESDGEWVAEEMRCHACTKAIEHGKKFSAASAPQALKISTRRRTQASSTNSSSQTMPAE